MKSFKPNSFFFYYLYFIQARMNIFWKRRVGVFPYTDDPILEKNKFTNAYRILDRASQYLIKNVIYSEKALAGLYNREDTFWRIIIYKHFNLPATWEALEKEFGDITLDISTEDMVEFLTEYNKEHVVYSNAYMTVCGAMTKDSFLKEYGLPAGIPKFHAYLRIFEHDLLENSHIYDVLRAESFEASFNQMCKVAAIGDFMGYQYAQDLNYSTLHNFDTNTFCAAGPGTRRGIERCFDIEGGQPDYGKIVQWVQQNYDQLVEDYSKKYDFFLQATQIPNLPLTVPDFSNCFCETDKYLRISGLQPGLVKGTKMKALFNPNPTKIDFVFPPKFNVTL